MEIVLLIWVMGRTAFSEGSFRNYRYASGPGILFEAHGVSLILFRRDAHGRFHLVRHYLSNLGGPSQDFILGSYPSELIFDSSGQKAFWFSAYGGTFRTLDLHTGKEKIVLTRQAGKKAFWMDPPYFAAFHGPDTVYAYGYPVDETGNGGDDGVYAINLNKEGVDAVTPVVTAAALSRGESKKIQLFLSDSDTIPYGLIGPNETELFRYDVKSGKTISAGACSALRKMIASPDGKSLAYSCGDRVGLQSFSDNEKPYELGGSYLMLDVDWNSASMALLKMEKKSASLGIERWSGGKGSWTPLKTIPLSGNIKAVYAEGEKLLLVSDPDGLHVYELASKFH